MIDSIIFDIDGTLVDTRAQVRLAWDGVVQELTGQPWKISDGDFTALFGQPMDAIAQVLFPKEADPAEQLRMANLCYEAENRWIMKHPGIPFPGAEEALQALSQRFPLYIVSNCQAGYIQAALEPLGLLKHFQGWMCYGDTGKPKAVTLRRLADRHCLSSPIYVGDTLGDEMACREAGIPFVYAAYGFGQADRPHATIRQLSDLITFCKSEEAL